MSDEETSMRKRLAISVGKMLLVAGGSSVHSAMNMALGASVLDSSGYADYQTSKGAVSGAIGGVFVGGIASFLVRADDLKLTHSKAIAYVGGTVLNGVLGYAIESILNMDSMTLDKTAAAAAVGASILLPCMVTAGLITACGLNFCFSKKPQETPDESSHLSHLVGQSSYKAEAV